MFQECVEPYVSYMRVVLMRCLTGQQVVDLLRDRLQSVGGELIETKNRVAELESAHVEERSTLCKANDTIASMSMFRYRPFSNQYSLLD